MPDNPPHNLNAPTFANDLLKGANQISEFLYGTASHRRSVYHLAETSRIPIFRLGAVLCARRSVLLAWIAHQEERGWPVVLAEFGAEAGECTRTAAEAPSTLRTGRASTEPERDTSQAGRRSRRS